MPRVDAIVQSCTNVQRGFLSLVFVRPVAGSVVHVVTPVRQAVVLAGLGDFGPIAENQLQTLFFFPIAFAFEDHVPG